MIKILACLLYAVLVNGQTANNVTAFGADPTGKNDSTKAIQAAITAAPSINGQVYFPQGNYRYTSLAISGKTNLTMYGNGSAVLTETNINPGAAVTVTSSPSLTVQGLIFDHATNNGYMWDVTSINVSFIDDVFENLGDGITNVVEAALMIAPPSNNLLVQGCTFQNLQSSPANAVRGIYVSNFRNTLLASTGARVIGNTFNTLKPYNNADGVVFDQQGLLSSALVSDNSFYNSYKRAVKLMTNGVIVSDNTIAVNDTGGQAYSAVSAYGDSITISHNTAQAYGCVSGCSFYAGWDLGGSNITLVGNTLSNPAPTTDQDIDCVNVDIGSTTNRETSYSGITIIGNTCNKFRYVRFLPNTPTSNLTISDNTFVSPLELNAIQFYAGSTFGAFVALGNSLPNTETLYGSVAAAGK